MAAEPIHVDAEDEVPAIIERIRGIPSDEVQLVLPPRARFGQSRFNFQLLRQYTTRLGKRVAIWSPDPAVQRLAEESGFGSFRPPQIGPVAPASASAPRAQRPGGPPPAGGPFPGRQPAPAGQEPGAAGPYGPPGRTRAGAARPGAGRPGEAGRTTMPSSAAQAAAMARIRIGAMGRRLPANITQYQPARYALYVGAMLVLLAGILA